MDSKLEASYFSRHLGWLEKAGEATEIKHHTVISLLPAFNYKTDWDYLDKRGVHRFVDTKGEQDARFKCILALWPFFGHGPLDVVKAAGPRFVTRTVMVGKWDLKQGPTGAWDFRKVA